MTIVFLVRQGPWGRSKFYFPWPFFSQELCRKAHVLGSNFRRGSSEDPHTEGGRIAETRTLTGVTRRYFGIRGRFSAVNRR